jgi:hypothetical protein
MRLCEEPGRGQGKDPSGNWMRAVAPFAQWNVLPEELMKWWRSRAMMTWRTPDGGVTNLITAVCLPFVRDFHQFVELSGGEADEISLVAGFQEYQDLLAAGWQLGRRWSEPKAKTEVWLQSVLISSMVLYELNVRWEARVREDDTWNWWMLRESEVYENGGEPTPQAEEPRAWAAFRQAVMRKMGNGSDQWQVMLRARRGPDEVIDPREDPPEEVPEPGFRPAGEQLPSMMVPGTTS